MADGESIRVVARFRPINERERELGDLGGNVKIGDDGRSVWVGPDEETGTYMMDAVLPPEAPQVKVYGHAMSELVESVMQGVHSSLLAYGQTGSGKTYSVIGEPEDEQHAGLFPRAAQQLFESIGADTSGTEITVRCSYLEVYKEIVRDLLDQSPAAALKPSRKTSLRDAVEASRPSTVKEKGLTIRESAERGVFVEGLTQTTVTSAEAVLACLKLGNANRAVGVTNMNSESSRSHAVLTLTVRQKYEDGSFNVSKLNVAECGGGMRTPRDARCARPYRTRNVRTTAGCEPRLPACAPKWLTREPRRYRRYRRYTNRGGHAKRGGRQGAAKRPFVHPCVPVPFC